MARSHQQFSKLRPAPPETPSMIDFLLVTIVFVIVMVVILAGIEPAASELGSRHSVQMSYRTVGIHRHKTSTDFICDICGHAHVERHGPSFDEGRAATSLMRQDGWHFTKPHGGAWEATCSTCNIDATESLDDVLR